MVYFLFAGLFNLWRGRVIEIFGQSCSIHVGPDLDWFIWVARLLRVFFHSKKVIGNCAFDVDEEKINRKHATDLDDCMACSRRNVLCVYNKWNVLLV